jgi:hypothetical protein
MSDLNKLTEKPEEKTLAQTKAQKNKKIILWAILVVVVLIVLYVLFGDNVKQFRLCTETRADLKNVAVSTVPVATSVASAASETSVGLPSAVTSDSASAVRRELANLFKSYA